MGTLGERVGRREGRSALVQAAITQYHRLGSLETIDIYFSQFWSLEVLGQSASMVAFW